MSRHSMVKDMMQANFKTITPSKLSMPNVLNSDSKTVASRNPIKQQAQTLDYAMAEDA